MREVHRDVCVCVWRSYPGYTDTEEMLVCVCVCGDPTQDILTLRREAGGGVLFMYLYLLETFNQLHIRGQHYLGLKSRVNDSQHVLH